MSATATILPANEIAVRHSVREEVGKEFLQFDIPNGWEDVKKISKKILTYEGRKFTFSCWNSDYLYCCFARPLSGDVPTATFSSK